MCRANLPAAFPLISQTFHYSNTQLSYIGAFSEAAYALGKFINGPLTDKIGGHKVFLAGLAGGIVFNFAFAASHTLFAFIIVWCFCRYFLSMGWGGLVKMIGQWYPPEKNGTIMGLISINFQFGGVLGTILAGYLVAWGFGWRGVFIYPALIGVVILIWSAFAAKERPGDVIKGVQVDRSHADSPLAVREIKNGERVSVRKIISALLRLRLFQYLMTFSFLMHVLRSFFFFWTAKFLVDIGMHDSTAIFSSALFPLFGCLGTILLGWYTDRFARRDRAKPMWMMLVILAGCLLAITLFIHSRLLVVMLLSACGFLVLAPYSMSAGALTLDIAGPDAAATSAGLLDGVGYIAGAIATFIGGYVSDHFGWIGVFRFLACSAIVAALSAYMMSRGFQKISD